MNKIVLVCAFLALAFSFTFVEKPTLMGSHPDLQFNDFTGRGATADMISSLTNFANSASSFYKDDVAANVKYIKEQMDKKYGDAGQNFFVFIQTEQVRFSWLVWITNQNVFASRTGINKIYPDWSYMFVKFLAPPTSQDYALVTAGKQGDGIDAYLDLINDVVNSNQSGDECTCNDVQTQNIGYGLINGSGRPWSTVCDATGDTTALVLGLNGLWAGIKPRKCTYTFYVSQ